MIVDLGGTGASWAALFSGLGQRARCAFLARSDDTTGPPSPGDWLDIASVFRTSELCAPMNKHVEMLNYAPHAVVEDVVRLPTGAHLPVLAESIEYDPALPEAVRRAFALCAERLARRPEADRLGNGRVEDLILTMVSMICADPALSGIYPGHMAADLAYERRVRG